MAYQVLVVYPQRCTGCRLCEQWCSWKHHGAVNPAKARVSIHRVHEKGVNVPVACSQCSKAPCIEVCPDGAISRDPATNAVILDESKCIGCRLCVESCPRGCIKVDADGGIPLLCDLCGGDPQCVKHCPEGALMYLELDKLDRGYREFHAARIAGGAR
jgi:Fe-S-cluster-containing hydrogenase component 2